MKGSDGEQGRCRVSGFFTSADAVDEAIYRLSLLGTPRDLVEVAGARATVERLYPKGGRRPQSQAARLAAVGALVGLLVGIGVSLVTVALPGMELPRTTAVVQLLGPNAGTVVGALIGALIGALQKPVSDFTLARALDRDGILVVVRHCDPRVAPRVREALETSGAEDLRVET